MPNGVTACKSGGGEGLGSERSERGCAAEMGMRALRGAKELPRGRVDRHRLVAAGKETMDSFVQCQFWTCALSGDDKQRRGTVAEHNMRAGAGERATDLRTKAVQSLVARRRVPLQGRGKPCDF